MINANIPIELIQTRAPHTQNSEHKLKAKAKLNPGKKYSWNYISDQNGNPITSAKEAFSPQAWERIKQKILAKKVFIDVNHKTANEINLNRYISQLQQETGKDLSTFRQKIRQVIDMNELPLIRLDDAKLEDDGITLEMTMNPHFRQLDQEHQAYYDATYGMIKDGYLNSLSLNFMPTQFKDVITDNNEIVKLIDDADVFGVSILNGPAHDDMFDTVEIAVRAAQNTTEGGTPKMAEDEKTKLKDEIKEELNADKIKEENARLKAEIDAANAKLKEQEEAKRQAELEAHQAEKAKLEAELEEKRKALAGHTPSRGMPPATPNPMAESQKVREIVKPRTWGEKIALQAEFNGIGNLPPHTQAALKDKTVDMHIPAKQR